MPWRPLPADAGDEDPRPVSASLARLARRLGAPAPDVLTAVFARWGDVVGPEVAAHSRPLSLRDGVLTVGVDQPGWATQLTFLKADLLARIAAASGGSGGVAGGSDASGDGDARAVREVRVRVIQPGRPGRRRPWPPAGSRGGGW